MKLEKGRHIALVSTPWPLFNRPSIQLGSLKAFFLGNIPGISVRTYHPYLLVAESIGYDCYRRISGKSWLAESVYAALLYPELFDTMEKFWWRSPSGKSSLPPGHDFQGLCRQVREASERFLDDVNWDEYLLTGFSICLGQLTSSLYYIRRIKQRANGLKIVIGGSSCAAEMGESLLQTFPELDFVVQGEGELPLLHLVDHLSRCPSAQGSLPLPGVLQRESPDGPSRAPTQVAQLDDLPVPDYEDYFETLNSLPSAKRFFPKIPMETSRGCWWRKRAPSGKPTGCAFCNLNLQWKGYRTKTGPRVIQEIEDLSLRHQALSISFMDNLLPGKGTRKIFMDVARLGKGYQFFAEIRATTAFPILAAMGEAGVETVQVGVEALSTSLLGKLNKGTTVMDNIQIMRDCETPGLPGLTGNLILHFPSSDEGDVAETLENLSFVLPFRPLQPAHFWLGYASPVYNDPRAFGIRKKGNHPHYARLFPPDVLRGLTLMIQEYYGRKRYQQRIWEGVRERVDHWRDTYEALHRSPGSGPILSYLDGKRFMVIQERRLDREDLSHRLTGTSRSIYLFCQRHRSAGDILARFPRMDGEKVVSFLNMMVKKRLMFREGNRYLSLAVPARHVRA
ncbi:MAG: RiPP maturation radical SAM C-methyltransferase [Desulfatiglandaceae bacterium]